MMRKPRPPSYRQQVLALDPAAYLTGPHRFSHYAAYSVHAGDGEEIGWTDGNEQGSSWAWLRALATLRRRNA